MRDQHPAMATAGYFGISKDDVHRVLRYYTVHTDELDQELKAHREAQQNYKRALEQREARARPRAANESSG